MFGVAPDPFEAKFGTSGGGKRRRAGAFGALYGEGVTVGAGFG